ncbi:1-deoxyxylulose-5-phosphate synthase YajO-like [Physella acuta]|uniref:1-deoxyxylulose-5-phosphate synthase YajO-like n=1 Tax=Physella acuta TaxID=109671 RepID=UPI0027DB94E2|nr:1-deoxyxylulose-5-phosphate synthase YajO-like [Physella acuta]
MATEIPKEKKLPSVFLGQSGLKVSNICLGAMTFGESSWGIPGQCDEDLSHQIIDRFVKWGGNFFDTADVYGRGRSEEILGKWLERQTRDNFIVATKVRSNMGTEVNPNNIGLSRRHITASIDASLGRLKTDYVDLYQAHCFDDAGPFGGDATHMDDLVRIGKNPIRGRQQLHRLADAEVGGHDGKTGT